MENSKLSKRIKVAGIIVFVSMILFIVFYQMNNSKKLLENERANLNQEILVLKNKMNEIKGISFKTKVTRDSLFRAINPYMPYEVLVKSTAQRDSIAKLLAFKYGDMVMVLPDSTFGIIESIIYGGNQYESFVKYKVLLKNKQYLEVNPTQLQVITKN
jgi:hypothetical protein